MEIINFFAVNWWSTRTHTHTYMTNEIIFGIFFFFKKHCCCFPGDYIRFFLLVLFCFVLFYLIIIQFSNDDMSTRHWTWNERFHHHNSIDFLKFFFFWSQHTVKCYTLLNFIIIINIGVININQSINKTIKSITQSIWILSK